MASNIKNRLQENNLDLASILSDINNLPPAGTEDASAELDAQTLAANNLIKIVKRKVAESKGEGTVVWNKYENYTPARTLTLTYSFGSTNYPSGNYGYFNVSVTNGTVSEITESMLVGHTVVQDISSSGLWKYVLAANNKLQVYCNPNNPYSGETSYALKYSSGSWSYSNGVVTIYDPDVAILFKYCSQGSGTFNSYNVTIPQKIGNLLGFVVSNDSSTYPNGGTDAEGKYYTKLAQV